MGIKEYIYLFKECVSTFGIGHDFTSIIFFVTNQCDSKCKGCLYWPKLNRKEAKDLTLDEIRKISKSMGAIWLLQISGGEPFLRKDLAEICKIFIKNNHTRNLSIPSNGLSTDKIVESVRNILSTCKCRLGVPISIDCTEPINYKLRGVKKSFERSLKTFDELNELKKIHKNFKVWITTRITNTNIKNIPALKEELISRGIRTKHVIFPIRGELKESMIRPPTADEYLNLMMSINKNIGVLDKVKYYLTSISLEGKQWPFKCIAGKRIGVIDSDGDVRLCELLNPIGNLRDHNYDFYTVWNSKEAYKQRELIKSRRCSAGCTHGCFIWSSFLNSPFHAFKILFQASKSI